MLNFLLIVIGIYLFFRIMAKWVAPWLLKRYINRAQKQYDQQNGNVRSKDGKTTIHIPRKDKKRNTRPNYDAEDIGFEEIE